MSAMSGPRAKKYLKDFNFKKLFVEELGWENHSGKFPVNAGEVDFTLEAIAQIKGVQVFLCQPDSDGKVPDYQTRRKIEKRVTKDLAYEHLVLFVDSAQTIQIWQWVSRQKGKPAACREHSYHPAHQDGEALIQKISHIHIPIDEYEAIDITGTVHKLKDAFDKDKITKKFYDRFKKEHTAFLKFIEGITETADKEWYASLMLNRLMFSYFIQAKGFLDGDKKYLQNRLKQVQEIKGKDNFQTFYRYFVLTLFHEGFGKEKKDRKLDPELTKLLGDVRYLNGGLFELHELETTYPDIDIPDKAFEKLFKFFDEFNWLLDSRALKNDKEINPDVLGYIFEKYINQKQMGAYYTKEDITDYISKNTIIPYLFDTAKKGCSVAFKPSSPMWALLKDNPDAYIYPAVRHGVIDENGEEVPLPEKIAAGIKDVKKRGDWNKAADAEFALPTETWREHVARRQRCLEIREKLTAGEVTEINDLITYNLDIRQFAEDVIHDCEGSDLLKAFWNAIRKVTVLDPTCGSGAFLFAALDILKSLYETCLVRMQGFIEDANRAGKSARKFNLFRDTLKEIDQHPNLDYFILKSIIVNNLYGVDIMEEAVEICKLRMFLKLMSEIENVAQLRPLPDIDFNVRAGNSLVGYGAVGDVKKSLVGTLGFEKAEVAKLLEEAEVCERAFHKFQEMQTCPGYLSLGIAESKSELRQRLGKLGQQMDEHLSGEYACDKRDFQNWRSSHEPFHWCIEFYGIMRNGFDVIIGNPPYVEYKDVKATYTVKGYESLPSNDLYAYTTERSYDLLAKKGRLGLIVPISIFGTDGFKTLQKHCTKNSTHFWVSCYSNRPSQLFDGAQKRLTVLVAQKGKVKHSDVFTSAYYRWKKEERNALFPSRIEYANRKKTFVVFDASLEKIGTQPAVELFEKMAKRKKLLGESAIRLSQHKLYYTRKFGYFLAFLDRIPKMKDIKTGKKRLPSELKELCFSTEQSLYCAIGILSSSAFFWYWNCLSDCRNLNKRDLLAFPISPDELPKQSANQIATAAKGYLEKLYSTSQHMEKSGSYIETFDYRATKPELDLIDKAIGKYLKLDAAQIDFLTSYDYKYRVGVDE